MTTTETAHCHLAVLTHMLGQVTQIHATMKDHRPAQMSLDSYKKAMSDIEAQREAMAFAVAEVTRIYGDFPKAVTVTGAPANADTPEHLRG